MRCTSISACRYHWSLVCSHPLVKHCPGCQLLVRTAAKDSQRPGGRSRSYIPPAVRVQSRSMHNCMSDPAIAPAIAKQSLARGGHAFRAKPATAAANPPPKGPQYRLLPPYTVRRFLRPKVRLRSGKRSMFAHPIRRIRPETYKPLPDGWE